MSAIFKKSDLLLIVGVLVIAAGMFAWVRLDSAKLKTSGASVQVLVDGVQALIVPGDALGTHEILGASGARNVIEITTNGVRMTDANCPDKRCVHKGLVPRGADTIICLPHRMIVRWVDAPDDPGTADEVDVVLQ